MIFEFDDYQIRYEEVARVVQSCVSRARNALTRRNEQDAVQLLDDADEKIRQYEQSELGYPRWTRSIRRHVSRARRLVGDLT